MIPELAAELGHRAQGGEAARRLAQMTRVAGDMGNIDADNTAWLKGKAVKLRVGCGCR